MDKDPIYNTSKNNDERGMNAYVPPTKEEKMGKITRIFILFAPNANVSTD